MATRYRSMVGVGLFGLLGLLGLVVPASTMACGGSGSGSAGKEPATATADAGTPETFGEVNPADVAALSVDAGAPTSSSPASSSSPTGAKDSAPGSSEASGPTGASEDECTSVGIDFEKRVRPKFKECYATGKKKDPNLVGKVRISVDIDMLGKIKSTKIVEKTLPDPVADCMLKAVKAMPLPDANKCRGKSITLPVQFPTPR